MNYLFNVWGMGYGTWVVLYKLWNLLWFLCLVEAMVMKMDILIVYLHQIIKWNENWNQLSNWHLIESNPYFVIQYLCAICRSASLYLRWRCSMFTNFYSSNNLMDHWTWIAWMWCLLSQEILVNIIYLYFVLVLCAWWVISKTLFSYNKIFTRLIINCIDKMLPF